MLTRQVPAYYAVIATVLGAAAVLAISHGTTRLYGRETAPLRPKMSAATVATTCSYNFLRLRGRKFTRPLVYAEVGCESPRFEALKRRVDHLVEEYRSSGRLTVASVYARDFRKSEWMSLNDAETYDPGSLLKVPTLMAWLDMAEGEPGLLDRSFVLERERHNGQVPQYPGAHIVPGRPYTVRQLLEYMIVQSDNNATDLLNTYVDMPTFMRVFTDLGLPEPGPHAARYPLTSRDYSVFMKALYNGSYLGPRMSDYAMDLLSRCTFDQGLRAAIPQAIPMAHKFGEAGNTQEFQLHETAVVMNDVQPYLVTVMTKGPDMAALASFIRDAGQLVNDEMSSR